MYIHTHTYTHICICIYYIYLYNYIYLYMYIRMDINPEPLSKVRDAGDLGGDNAPRVHLRAPRRTQPLHIYTLYTHTCYVYIYIYTHTHTYIYMYIYMFIYTYMFICIYVYIYIYVKICSSIDINSEALPKVRDAGDIGGDNAARVPLRAARRTPPPFRGLHGIVVLWGGGNFL